MESERHSLRHHLLFLPGLAVALYILKECEKRRKMREGNPAS